MCWFTVFAVRSSSGAVPAGNGERKLARKGRWRLQVGLPLVERAGYDPLERLQLIDSWFCSLSGDQPQLA